MKYLEYGTGPEQILWLHGGNVAGWMWGPQVPEFADYLSIVPDLPGFGASNDEEWVSIAATADELARLLTEPAHVVGLSLGSSIALELAARHPQLVSSLFLASTQAAPPRRRDVIVGQALLGLWNRRGFWVSTAKSYGLEGDDADLFITTGLGIKQETARAILAEVKQGIADATLANLHPRTHAIAGGKDSPAVWRDSLERLAKAGASTEIAAGMHHQFNVENPALFNSALREWLFAGSKI